MRPPIASRRLGRFPHRWLATALAAAVCCGPARAAETVKIAFIDILSGPFGVTGQAGLKQLREVVTHLNAKARGNEPRLEIVAFDNKGGPQESINALKSAADQGIRYITQGGGSSVAFALSDAVTKLAEREPEKAIVYLNFAAMDPGLTNDRCSFWHFRFYPSAPMIIEALTTYIAKRPDIKVVYILGQNYSHGVQVAKYTKETLARKRPDIKIVGEDLHPLAQVRDFAPYIAKIKESGADTVITSNWGSDLTLMFKSAREFGLDINFFTLNANNPGTPAQMGPWGAGKVGVVWNWTQNSMSGDLEKISSAYRQKYDEEFIFASHWNSMSMLLQAMQQAKSTDPKRVAFALEGMTAKGPNGEVTMRKTDHQLQAPLYLNVWEKQGTAGVKYDSEHTGYGFRPEAAWDAYVASQPTSCQMKRPAP